MSNRASDNRFTRWEDIEDLVKRWCRRYPEKFEMNKQYIQAVKEGLIDSTYASQHKQLGKGIDSGGSRLGLAIPPELMNYIQTFYPDFMDTKEDMRTFGKKFPAFQIPEKM